MKNIIPCQMVGLSAVSAASTIQGIHNIRSVQHALKPLNLFLA